MQKTKNIDRQYFTNQINKKIGLNYNYSKKILNNLIDVLNSQILIEKKLTLKNICTFSIKNKKERKGRNPKTLQSHTITSRKVISIKVSEKLYKRLNVL